MSPAAEEAEAERYARRRLQDAVGSPPPRGTVLAVVLCCLLVAATVARSQLTAAGRNPAARPGDGTAVLTDDGGLYVVDGSSAYPAVNLASALLASDRLVHAPSSVLDGFGIGRPRGIPGAPAVLPLPARLVGTEWQLCTDGRESVSLTFGSAPYLSPPAREIVVLDDGERLWSVRDGRRSPASGPEAGGHAVPTLPELVALIPLGEPQAPGGGLPSESAGRVVCAQSDPAAPFARPTAASLERGADGEAVVVPAAGIIVTLRMPARSGVLMREGDGYLLLGPAGELSPVADDRALRRLGYSPDSVAPIPPQLLALLPRGPTLSVEAATAPAVPAPQPAG